MTAVALLIGAVGGALLGAAGEHLRLRRRPPPAELVEDAGRYKTLTDNLMASVVIRDSAGKIDYCSPFTEVLTGYPVSEIRSAAGDFFESVMHEEDREAYRRALGVASLGEPFQFRYRFYHRSGLELWAETRTMPILGADGSVSSTLSITLDVTAAVRHQRQLEERNRDLHDFSYMLSHDLKAPLFTVKGMTAILGENVGDSLNPETSDLLNHISGAVRRLEALVESVLEYSKISLHGTQSFPVELSPVVADVLQDLSARVNESRAAVHVDGDLPVIAGEPVRMYQVFSNLIGNALKYRSPDRTPEIRVSSAPAKARRYVTVTVADNGTGIPSGKLDEIFRPFHRAHGREIEGTGIGLASVKKLVEKSGGSIAVRSEEGVGSEFILTLRRAEKGGRGL